jgi:hypothetical protein
MLVVEVIDVEHGAGVDVDPNYFTRLLAARAPELDGLVVPVSVLEEVLAIIAAQEDRIAALEAAAGVDRDEAA